MAVNTIQYRLSWNLFKSLKLRFLSCQLSARTFLFSKQQRLIWEIGWKVDFHWLHYKTLRGVSQLTITGHIKLNLEALCGVYSFLLVFNWYINHFSDWTFRIDKVLTKIWAWSNWNMRSTITEPTLISCTNSTLCNSILCYVIL